MVKLVFPILGLLLGGFILLLGAVLASSRNPVWGILTGGGALALLAMSIHLLWEELVLMKQNRLKGKKCSWVEKKRHPQKGKFCPICGLEECWDGRHCYLCGHGQNGMAIKKERG